MASLNRDDQIRPKSERQFCEFIFERALRRDKPESNTTVHEFRRMIQDHRVQMIGPIRQEILSGIRSESQFNKLQKHLESFPDLPATTEDYVTAAKYFNRCRTKGIQGSNTDFLKRFRAIFEAYKNYSPQNRIIPTRVSTVRDKPLP